jgi:hypothetical protein
VPYDALAFKGYGEAQAAMDALEAEHGELHYAKKRFVQDVENLTADFLIAHTDAAFEAWRERPWAHDVTFDAFCNYILPYRSSNEPAELWRDACAERLGDLTAELEDPTALPAASNLALGRARGWIGFSTQYYLHPTDQGYAEMTEMRRGRCEDMTNLYMYALRSQAILGAADYTPYWANRDNNHAWEVLLDANGAGRAGLSNRAAKIYRKTYAIQPDALGTIKDADESVPRWLSGRNYRDVTDQYLDTVDVTVTLTRPRPDGATRAYLCVFNGGGWRAIHWGAITGEQATFSKMGRRIAYLPAYFEAGELIAAAPPFLLDADGYVRTFDGGARTVGVNLAVTAPDTPDADTGVTRPTLRITPGNTYELFAWTDGDWASLGRRTAGTDPVKMDGIPGGRLYWLVADGSRRLERIFTIDEGRQIFW